MKYLKKITPALYLFIASACMTSCTQWLDLQPFDQILEDEVYSDKHQMNKALNGLYLHLANDKLYGKNLSCYTIELLGQWYNYTQSSLGDELLTTLPGFYYTHKNIKSHFDALFEKAYTVIRDVNYFIEKTEATDGVISDAHKDILLGEAYALRAFLHFDMLRLFGPLPKKNSEDKAIPYYTKASQDWSAIEPNNVILGYILKDLDVALKLLENDKIRTVGVLMGDDVENDFNTDYRNRRLNYFAVQTLKARVLLYQGTTESIAAAGAIAKTLIETEAFHKAFPWTSYAEMSAGGKEDKIFSKEVMFGIHNDDLYSQWENMFAPSNTASGTYFATHENSIRYAFNIAAAADFKLSQDWRAQYWSDWVRKTNAAPLFLTNKFRKPSNETEFLYFQPLIRKSEVYLIAAEVFQENRYADSVRLNRGLKRINEELASYTLQEQIRKEYMKETLCEGQLFFYYKRREETKICRYTGVSTGTLSAAAIAAAYVLPLPKKETER